MKDQECTELLQWALPRLHLRWRGFRRVRRQVCRRVSRRLEELGLPDGRAYREFLESHPAEWPRLDALCRITISRFWRNAQVFGDLSRSLLPRLAEGIATRGETSLACWSAGCASGEEPYSLVLAWNHRLRARFPALSLRVVATDADPVMIERARAGCYPASSVRDLPAEWLASDFTREDGLYRIAAEVRDAVEFRVQDVRHEMPDGPLHLVLCRNLVFTYFDETLQRTLLEEMRARLAPGGALVVGSHEQLPADIAD